MSARKYFNSKTSVLAVIFLLLNLICTASAVYAAADISREGISSIAIQDLLPAEEEAIPVAEYLFKSAQVNRIGRSVNSGKVLSVYNMVAENIAFTTAKRFSISVTPVPQPAYYIFLFRCSLF